MELLLKNQIPESISDLFNQNFQGRSPVTCIFKKHFRNMYLKLFENPKLEGFSKCLSRFLFDFSLTGNSNYICPIENYEVKCKVPFQVQPETRKS